MQLITGGLGFIGLHTARACLDAGEDVVLTQYRVAREPDFIKNELGKRAFVEQLDVTDKDRLMEIGKKYKVTGITHLAVPALNALSANDDFRVNMFGLLNILEAGQEWEVKRIGLASSNAVYGGAQPVGGFNREDMPLTVGAAGAANATATWKKCFELIGSYWAARTNMDIVNLRIAGIYGPLYHSMSNLPSRLVHAAVKGEAPQLRGDTYAEDGGDSTYVRDCGRGIALLMTADKLNFNTYNIASGQVTTSGQFVSAIQKVIPSFKGDFLKEGASPTSRGNSSADLTRIKSDVGYEPQFLVDKAIPDYINWIRSGNPE
jgi:UDP-glucose 4-epimerase